MTNLYAHWMKLKSGDFTYTQFRPLGGSMEGLVPSGALVKVESQSGRTPVKDDVVLARVKGNVYLHKVLGIQKDRFLIGNNRGGVNGWVSRDAIAGFLTEIEGSSFRVR